MNGRDVATPPQQRGQPCQDDRGKKDRHPVRQQLRLQPQFVNQGTDLRRREPFAGAHSQIVRTVEPLIGGQVQDQKTAWAHRIGESAHPVPRRVPARRAKDVAAENHVVLIAAHGRVADIAQVHVGLRNLAPRKIDGQGRDVKAAEIRGAEQFAEQPQVLSGATAGIEHLQPTPAHALPGLEHTGDDVAQTAVPPVLRFQLRHAVVFVIVHGEMRRQTRSSRVR